MAWRSDFAAWISLKVRTRLVADAPFFAAHNDTNGTLAFRARDDTDLPNVMAGDAGYASPATRSFWLQSAQ
jgi:hypothetical protein